MQILRDAEVLNEVGALEQHADMAGRIRARSRSGR
jgi:hypothetical protein